VPVSHFYLKNGYNFKVLYNFYRFNPLAAKPSAIGYARIIMLLWEDSLILTKETTCPRKTGSFYNKSLWHGT
jgi:hypothetical protein